MTSVRVACAEIMGQCTHGPEDWEYEGPDGDRNLECKICRNSLADCRPDACADLEWRLIYSIIVAGKSAKFADGAMRRLDNPDFNAVQSLIQSGTLGVKLRKARTGNYAKLERALVELTQHPIDLKTVGPERLEMIHGIGPKTARFFIIWTRPEAVYAALDVHVLRWLRTQGHDAPRSTPSGEKYRALELIFIEEASKRGMTPRQLDYQIWAEGSGYQEPPALEPKEAQR